MRTTAKRMSILALMLLMAVPSVSYCTEGTTKLWRHMLLYDFNIHASTDTPLVGLVISHVYLRVCRDYPSRVKDWRSVPMTAEERTAFMEGMAEKDGAKLAETYMDAVDTLVKEGKRDDSPYARSGAGSSASPN